MHAKPISAQAAISRIIAGQWEGLHYRMLSEGCLYPATPTLRRYVLSELLFYSWFEVMPSPPREIVCTGAGLRSIGNGPVVVSAYLPVLPDWTRSSGWRVVLREVVE